MENVIDKLKFNSHGLIPAVVIDADSGRLLMVAYMNRESLEITLREGCTCFWSRSRQELWRKGETSGNRQKVVSITADCDYDTLEVKVHKLGPACHTGAESCFFNELKASEEPEPFSIQGLYELLLDRKAAKPEGSYTSYLFEKGLDKILKKVGEESTEVHNRGPRARQARDRLRAGRPRLSRAGAYGGAGHHPRRGALRARRPPHN